MIPRSSHRTNASTGTIRPESFNVPLYNSLESSEREMRNLNPDLYKILVKIGGLVDDAARSEEALLAHIDIVEPMFAIHLSLMDLKRSLGRLNEKSSGGSLSIVCSAEWREKPIQLRLPENDVESHNFDLI